MAGALAPLASRLSPSTTPSMSRVAIVMPVLNEAERLAQTLAQFGQRVADVIVVDGGSRDGSIAVALRAGARVTVSDRGRARQMNTGAALAAHADVLLFVHADVQLPENWVNAISRAIQQGAAWGRFDVVLDSPRSTLSLVGAMMNLRSRLTGIATGDQAIFITRTAWERVGPWPDIPLMEDIRMSTRLVHAVGRPACLKERVRVSARRWEQRGVMRTIVLMWTLRALHATGMSPTRLHRLYYGTRPDAERGATPGRIIVFAKVPRAGEVKTRLAATRGDSVALDTHRRLLEHTLSEAARVPGVSVELCTAGDDTALECRKLAHRFGAEFSVQVGRDLGERMAAALRSGLDRGERVVLVGCDSPVLHAADLAEALAALDGVDRADAVFAPTEDGGYVLVGAAKALPPVFDGMHWSHSEVMQQTLARLESAGMRYRLLRTLWDVDDEEGWKRWQALSASIDVAL